ncbi:stage II sporulation protein D [Sutcliffiella horikoshii]|uniref:Stage II sporulation protein D n=1 Tax=Sutcliffiella horikoshii TaxID=79883 RepID=A0AA94WRE2_9BACI|nr:stage II sporulation protein D [Sutcliffiella horikoshii]TYS59832.1 stage II sporulation protein D [Sutcliffiella horikoshii]
MRNLKPIIVLTSILFVMVLMVPTLLVMPFVDKENGQLAEELQPNQQVQNQVEPIDSPIDVAVYRHKQEMIEKIPLEDYIVGVVASEMPADFELEALKAQALAARTYILRQLMAEEKLGTPEGADVTDTEQHQVYKSPEELKAAWAAEDFNWKMEKIKQAVAETAGSVLTYNNAPIDASYFSTSNGFTENSEEYWPNEIPYLRSVESPWDVDSEKYLSQVSLPIQDFQSKLGVTLGSDGSVGKIISRTTGNRVEAVDINGKKLSGREVRDILKLRSSDFTWERKGDNIVITTKGFGHGVGMSQYGANGMALEGKNYTQIISHYYKDVQIASADQYLNKVTAKR